MARLTPLSSMNTKSSGLIPAVCSGHAARRRLHAFAAGLVVLERLFLRVWRRRKSIRPTVAALSVKPATNMPAWCSAMVWSLLATAKPLKCASAVGVAKDVRPPPRGRAATPPV